MASNLEALRRKGMDVVQTFEPYVSMALRDDLGKILYAASTRGATVYTTFLATRSGIERHRDALLAMSRAIGMHAGLACGAQRRGTGAGEHGFLPACTARHSGELACALSRCRALVAHHEVSRQGFARLAESLLSGGFHLAHAAIRGLRG